MADISSYPVIAPKSEDLIIGSETYTVATPVIGNPTRNFTMSSIAALSNSIGLGYTVYTALISQTGTAAPVATVLQNTTSGTIAWVRDSLGNYGGVITGGAFTADKTLVFVNQGGGTSTANIQWGSSTTKVTIITAADSVLTKASIEIRIYA
jgi:hypothetical protein